MLHLSRLLVLAALLIFSHSALGQRSLGVAFYDVDQLYDTIPSPFYDDSDFTPEGQRGWNTERYRRKIELIASVVDSLKMPIVVLYGVESRDVVRDIQRCSRLDYSSHHRDLDYYDGLDFAVLYYGDQFYVNKVSGDNFYSYFGGEFAGRSIGVHLTRRGGRLHSTLPPHSNTPDDITIAWGSLTHRDLARLDLAYPLVDLERSGRGDSRSSGRWYMHKRLGVKLSEGVEVSSAGVYITKALLSSDERRPWATYSSSGYLGGYSRHLPHYIFIKDRE